MNTQKKYTYVIGDIILDDYIYGDVNRISPESYCPVFKATQHSYVLGGAANVAKQINHSLANVKLMGIIGNDVEGTIIRNLLEKEKINASSVFVHDARSITKKRFINKNHQQMFRVDIEERMSLSDDERELIKKEMENNEITNVVISDYDKGLVTEDFCQELIYLSKKYGFEVIIDIKDSNVEKYKGATIVKGNNKEIGNIIAREKVARYSLEEQLSIIREKVDAKLLIMTQGEKGLVAVDDRAKVYQIPSQTKSVFDVTGAGDIITAFCSILRQKEFDTERMLTLANKAANLKVEHFGNSLIHINEVVSPFKKLKNLNDLLSIVQNKKIVFTNGCFDILHAGHVDLLQKAKEQGDVLVVGLNSDRSISKLKGSNRPINPLEYRISVLSAIEYIDYIVVFDDDTPLDLIRTLKPTVLVKGGDYTIDKIVGADFVIRNGGTVMIVPFTYNISSTKIINKKNI